MNYIEPDFFLASGEGHIPDQPRQCWVLGRSPHLARPDLAIVKLQPPISIYNEKVQMTVGEVLLCSRQEGYSLMHITEWPLFVDICMFENPSSREFATKCGELVILGWGEIYKTMQEAILNNRPNSP